MKVRHGKLLTKEREQLVADYQRRRKDTPPHPWDGHGHAQYFWKPYRAWVDGFERFMCRGLDKRTDEPPLVALARHDHIWRMRHRRSLSQTWRMPADQTQALDRWIDAFCATQPDTARNAATAGECGAHSPPAKETAAVDTTSARQNLGPVDRVATGMGKCHLSLPRR